MSSILGSKLTAICALAAWPALVTAADVAATWSATEKPTSLGDGALTFAYSGDRVTAITATPSDCGTISLSGDELPLAADATVSITAPGKLVVANAVTAVGDVSVSGCDTMTRIWNDGAAAADIAAGGDGGNALLPADSFALMFENMDLDDWEPVAFDASQTKNQPTTCWYKHYFRADYFKRETVGGQKQMTVDLSAQGSTESWRKFFRILLVQDGTSVKGKLVNAWYAATSSKQADSVDEELLDPQSNLTTQDLAVPGNVKGYGVTSLSMRCLRPSSAVRFDGTVTVPTANRIGVAGNVLVDGTLGAVTSTVAERTPNFTVSGALALSGRETKTGTSSLRGQLEGNGVVWVRGETALSQWGANSVFEDYSPNFLSSRAWIDGSRYGCDITNATAVFSGTEVGSSVVAKLYYLKSDPANTTGSAKFAQFQAVVGDRIVCAYVRFSQSATTGAGATDLYGQWSSAWAVPNAAPYALGVDFDDIQSSATSLKMATSAVGEGLAVSELRLAFAKPRGAYLRHEDNRDFWNNMGDPTRFLIAGTDEREETYQAVSSNSLPRWGVVEVRKNGCLQMVASGVDRKGYNGGGARIVVRRGGRLWQHADYPFADSQKVTLDGGEMRTGVDQSVSGVGSSLHYLVLRDGAHVLGNPMRINTRVLYPYFAVCGNEPSSFDSPLVLTGAGAADREFQLRVADVTGDDKVDFFLNGRITDFNATLTNTVIRKLGAGTVQMGGEARHHGPVRIEAGAWRLGKSGVTCANPTIPTVISLCGGKLVAAAGTSNTIGRLCAEGANGLVEIEDGATLTLSSLALSQATAPVVVVGDLTKRTLRIGDGSTPVSRTELDKIRWLKDGELKRIKLDSEGWAGIGGLVIIFR